MALKYEPKIVSMVCYFNFGIEKIDFRNLEKKIVFLLHNFLNIVRKGSLLMYVCIFNI